MWDIKSWFSWLFADLHKLAKFIAATELLRKLTVNEYLLELKCLPEKNNAFWLVAYQKAPESADTGFCHVAGCLP